MKYSPLGCWLALGSVVLCLSDRNYAIAQIVPDATLPNNSIVTPQGNSSVIEGGTRAGGNLFHSFREFSIPTGGEAFFNNAVDVQNIFSRVTGGSISNIDGLIRANGTANLFLLNPNGIIFGANARLNIGGSFFGSTASSIRFTDGTEFSAANPQATPLLTISVPIGLQYGSNPGRITVQGEGAVLPSSVIDLVQFLNNPVGLRVEPGRTLALVGGDVTLEGGILKAPQGRIELGSVASAGLVSLNANEKGFALAYQGISNFGNIQLSQLSVVFASGEGGGGIQVQGGRVNLTGNTVVVAGNFGNQNGGTISIQTRQLRLQEGSVITASTFGQGAGGNLTVNASESVELIGTSSYVSDFRNLFSGNVVVFKVLNNSLNTDTFSTGNAGNLMISTGRLVVQNGALIYTRTSEQEKGGNLTVNASDAIELIGNSGLSSSTIFASTGNSGNVTIDTARLTLQDGAFISSSVFLQGGKAGNLTVKASNAIELMGNSRLSISSLTGEGGNVTIDTGRLTLKDGASISTDTFGQEKAGNLTVNASDAIEMVGNSRLSTSGRFTLFRLRGDRGNVGNVTIDTGRLTLKDGAFISTDTFGQGKAGNLTVKASDAIELMGKSRLSTSAESLSTGDGGNLTIETPRLRVADEAVVSVRSVGSGKAGNVIVDAGSIWLENSSRLTADTKAGGGSIELRSPIITLRRGSNITTDATGGESGGDIKIQTDFLLLREGSTITTNALGIVTGTEIKGGNITIDADVIAALEDSDISANSDSFFGGQVFINTEGIFGTQFRAAPILDTPESDITASSAAGSQFSGTVTINTPNVDPSSGLIELPQNFVDVSGLIVDPCAAVRQGSSFAVTGRGGIPAGPDEPLGGEGFLVDLVTVPADRTESQRVSPQTANQETGYQVGDRITEATGWIINDKGQVVLTASHPNMMGDRWWRTPPGCTVSPH